MSKAKLLRRSIGSVCLVGALTMLAFGDTHPASARSPLAFAVYWLSCFLLAAVAMLMAVLDLFAVRREARREQRRLFNETVEQIQAEGQKRESGKPQNEWNES